MLFYEKGSFDEDIGGWDTSKVTTMFGMFYDNAAFDQDISGWDTSKCTNMANMFYFATAFSQDLSPWCVQLISSEPSSFGNAGTDPSWGAGNCPTACSTGADGNACENSGFATGTTPYGDSVADTCSCACAGESAAERAS
jgi:surface protein